MRAARGLPEDLIRLCVGIEDPDDLIEDLERALLEAGAITLIRTAEGEEAYARIGHSLGGPLGQSLDKLTNDLNGLGLEGQSSRTTPQEYLVSAPGKVILFGEHAVVHGVVWRDCPCIYSKCWLIFSEIDGSCCSSGPPVLRPRFGST